MRIVVREPTNCLGSIAEDSPAAVSSGSANSTGGR
jgi:hypothetical protein